MAGNDGFFSFSSHQITRYLQRNTGSIKATRERINFIEGANVTLTLAENAANDSLDLTVAASGGSGAPTTAEYLVGATDGTLSAERLVTNTATVTWDLATAGQAKANVPTTSFGPPDASYLTLATDANLTSERVATAGQNVAFTDLGAGSTLTVNVGTQQFKLTGMTAEQPSGTQNDYALMTSDCSIVESNNSFSDGTLTGLQGGAEGRLLFWKHTDPSTFVAFSHEDAASSAANRFVLGGAGATVYMYQNDWILFLYYESRWNLVASSNPNIKSYSISLDRLATININRVLASDGSGIISQYTTSQVIDFIGTTRGSLIYRGAATWGLRTPGTSGYPLVSAGTGADPDYAQLAAAGIASDAVTTAKILDANVTYAKIQDVTATQRALGRNTAGSGDVEEVTATQLLDWIGSTRGSVLYRGASGWAILSPGTSGYFLKSNGAGADPSYAASTGLMTEITKSADQDVTNSTTLTDDTELQFSGTGGKSYYLELDILYSGNDTAKDYKCLLAVSAGDFSGWHLWIGDNTAGNAIYVETGVRNNAVSAWANTAICGVDASHTTRHLRIETTMKLSADATIKFQFAQNNAGAATVARTKQNSRLRYRQLD